MTPPLSLRDARRLLNVGSAYRARLALEKHPRAPGYVEGIGYKQEEWTSFVDALISRHGARATVDDVVRGAEGEARPKNTDEVAPVSSQTSDAVHGGDGNSGEVYHESLKPSPTSEPAGAPEHDHASRPGDPTDGSATEDRDMSRREMDSVGGAMEASHDGELTAGVSTSIRSDEDYEQTPPRDAGTDASSSSDIGDPDDANDLSTTGEDVSSLPDDNIEEGAGESTGPRPVFGGRYAEEVRREMQMVDRRDVACIRRALNRLVKATEVGIGDEQSPRWDYARLVSRLQTRAGGLQRARREELERSTILIAPDVSGSCSAVCRETMAAAMAMALDDDRVVVLEHSNGFVCSLFSRAGGKVDFPPPASREEEDNRGGWGWCIDLDRVAAVIALGDWDAGDIYRDLCESGAELYWLDSYCKIDGPRPASRNLRQPCRYWRRQPAGHWQGVGDVKSTAIALRTMAKERRIHA